MTPRFLQVILIVAAFISYTNGSPEITVFDKVAIVYEGTSVNEILSTITCDDPDGDSTDTYVQSQTPNSPCSSCFEVLHCAPNECLQYRAGVGTLSYSSAQTYLITIACTDNKETPATEVIEVIVKPNSPPYFDPDIKFDDITVDARATAAGALIQDMDCIDDENDDISYSLKVTPATQSSKFKINSITGEITAAADMRTICGTDVTLSVYCTDGRTTTGPLAINTAFSNPNTPPVAINLDTTVMIPEDSSGTAYTMNFVDGDGDPVTYNYTTTNTAGAAQFKIDGKSPNIDVQGALDYETSTLRQTDLSIQASDGYCASPKYNLRLQVTDVNEKPTITPVDSDFEVCEYEHEFDPGYVLSDPDRIDTQKWTLGSSMGNVLGYYSINHDTGDLQTIDTYNVDNPDNNPGTKTYFVKVEDKGGLTATATVSVTFLDCNDNAPVMVQPAYGRATSECTEPGTIIGRIQATDLDSAREGNNVITFSGSGGAVSVDSGGNIVVNSPLPAGNVVTFNAYAEDQGLTPGSLRSINPAVISVRFTPCPTTPPPMTAGPTAAPATTTTTTTTTSFTRESDDPNLPWIIIAALLGTFMLGLLSFMLWRYGSLCAQACSKFNCAKSCKGRPAKPKPPKIVEEYRREPMKRKPPARPKSEPEIEEPPEPERPKSAFLHGFWKEQFLEDDMTQVPNRKALPVPTDMNFHNPNTYVPAEQPQAPAAQAVADAPGKKCAIM